MFYQIPDQYSLKCEGQGRRRTEELSQIGGVYEDMKTECMWCSGWTPGTQ